MSFKFLTNNSRRNDLFSSLEIESFVIKVRSLRRSQRCKSCSRNLSREERDTINGNRGRKPGRGKGQKLEGDRAGPICNCNRQHGQAPQVLESTIFKCQAHNTRSPPLRGCTLTFIPRPCTQRNNTPLLLSPFPTSLLFLFPRRPSILRFVFDSHAQSYDAWSIKTRI